MKIFYLVLPLSYPCPCPCPCPKIPFITALNNFAENVIYWDALLYRILEKKNNAKTRRREGAENNKKKFICLDNWVHLIFFSAPPRLCVSALFSNIRIKFYRDLLIHDISILIKMARTNANWARARAGERARERSMNPQALFPGIFYSQNTIQAPLNIQLMSIPLSGEKGDAGIHTIPKFAFPLPQYNEEDRLWLILFLKISSRHQVQHMVKIP